MIRHNPRPLIEFLNEALKIDPEAIISLVEKRVRCNEKMADHPSIQVGSGKIKGSTKVGLLGLLNGFCGTIEKGRRKGWGPITAVVDDDTLQITGFELTEGA